MLVGLPLLQLVTERGLRAVIAHEYGHYAGGDTRLGPWIYRTRETDRAHDQPPQRRRRRRVVDAGARPAPVPLVRPARSCASPTRSRAARSSPRTRSPRARAGRDVHVDDAAARPCLRPGVRRLLVERGRAAALRRPAAAGRRRLQGIRARAPRSTDAAREHLEHELDAGHHRPVRLAPVAGRADRRGAGLPGRRARRRRRRRPR